MTLTKLMEYHYKDRENKKYGCVSIDRIELLFLIAYPTKKKLLDAPFHHLVSSNMHILIMGNYCMGNDLIRNQHW